MSYNPLPTADDPSSPPLPGRKATENEDDDDLSIMSEELEEDPEAEPADGEGEDDDEDDQRWASCNDAPSSSLSVLDRSQTQTKEMAQTKGMTPGKACSQSTVNCS